MYSYTKGPIKGYFKGFCDFRVSREQGWSCGNIMNSGPRGLLQKNETYLPVGTFWGGWYVYMM